MGRSRSLSIALLGVVALGLVVVLIGTAERGRGRDAGRGEKPRESGAASGTLAEVAAEIAAREVPAQSPSEPEPADIPKGSSQSSRPAAGPLAFAFDGRVVDLEERPIASAEVRLLGHRFDGRVLVRADESGRLAGSYEIAPDDPDPHRWTLEIGATGFACHQLSTALVPGASVHLGTIRLAPGGEVRGRVLDARGQPLAHADVSWRHADERPHDEATARRDGIATRRESGWRGVRTGHDGCFHWRGVPEGELFLVAGAGGHAYGWTETFLVRAGSLTELDVTLPPGERRLVRVHGRVLDPERRPAPGVRVEVEQGRFGGLSLVSDASGAFDGKFEHDPDGDLIRVVARDPELRGYPAELEGLDLERRPLELVLGRPRFLDVSFVDPEGEPVPWGHVRVNGESSDRSWRHELAPAGVSGTARILLPRAAFSLEAMAPGFATEVVGPIDPATVATNLVISLRPGQAVSGRVVARGRPVAGARIGLERTWDPSGLQRSIWLAVNETPFIAFGSNPTEPRNATTGKDGRFVITLHADGWHTLVVAAEGFPTTLFGPYELERAVGLEGLELELLPAGALEGRVLVPAGKSSAGRLVGASNGWSFASIASVGEDGRYRIEGLAPGRYQVRECQPPAAARAHFPTMPGKNLELRWDCEVRAGVTTSFDLDLRGEEDFVLEGRVRLPEGAVGWRVRLNRPENRGSHGFGAPSTEVSLGSQGEFRFALARGGKVELSITEDAGGFHAQLELAPGLNTWSLEPQWTTLRFEGLEALTQKHRLHIVQGQAEVTEYRRTVARPKGAEAQTISVPAGRLRLQVLESGDVQREIELEARADELTTVDVATILQPR